jgi:hypothetical protein
MSNLPANADSRERRQAEVGKQCVTRALDTRNAGDSSASNT